MKDFINNDFRSDNINIVLSLHCEKQKYMG